MAEAMDDALAVVKEVGNDTTIPGGKSYYSLLACYKALSGAS